jgi:hypothetical protein
MMNPFSCRFVTYASRCYDYACYLYLVASGRNTRQLTSVSAAKRKTGSYLVPFGYLVLYGGLKIGEGIAVHRGVLLGGFNAAYIFRISGVVSNVVSGVYLVCCVQVTLDEGLINTSINVRKLRSCQGVALLPLFTEMPRREILRTSPARSSPKFEKRLGYAPASLPA